MLRKSNQTRGATYEIKTMNAMRKDIKDIPISTLLHNLKCPSKSDITHDIKRKPTSPRTDINTTPPTVLTTLHLSLCHDIAKIPHMLQNMLLHRLDHLARQRLRQEASFAGMRLGVNGRQGAVAAEEVAKDVVEAGGLLGVSFGAVGGVQAADGVDGDAVGAVADYVACSHDAYVCQSRLEFTCSHSCSSSFLP